MNLVSHGHDLSLTSLIDRLKTTPPSCGTKRALELVDELMQFELGRFLIENRGLNGIWTSYIVLHPIKGRITRLNSAGQPFSDLESWLLNRAPAFLATQERFAIFQELTQQNLKSGMQLASIPCGLMDDLLSLDYSGLHGVEVTGIDLDDTSLKAAAINFDTRKPLISAHFEKKDAWTLDTCEHWDFITSNGLNIYIPEDSKVTQLYRQFHQSLKPAGQLLISFLSKSPSQDPQSPWEIYDKADLKLHMLLFSEILQIKWQSFRTVAQTRAQLEAAGFEVQTVRYDGQRLFPTVLAKKKAI